jgi:predicted nucleic acid-binding protein
MSLVLDYSATLAWLYPDETTDAIRSVFETIHAEGCYVPMLWRLEVANGLTVAVRRRRITAGFRNDALSALALAAIDTDGETSAFAWTGTLQLADRFGLTLYDAAYLELAQRRSLPLASLDVELRGAAQALGLPVLGV